MDQQVIISGAGPVGCWLACELQLAGVQTLLIEQTQSISPQSRALTIHPRTIEVFAMRGAHHEMLQEAIRIPSGHFAIFEHRLDFKTLDTDFAFTLVIPQARITEILQARALALGALIRRGEKVCQFTEDAQGVRVLIENQQGQYTAQAQWLIGCDGTRSTVRKQAEIAFPGTDATVFGWLSDVTLSYPPQGHLVGKWGLEGTALIAQLPDGQHRLVGVSPDEVGGPRPGELSLEELREKVRAIFGSDFGLHSPTWLSRYGNASRLAERYRVGRILLAGDAAHQHMPAGGVGLNVGIQDAMNLGWKLAAVINEWMPDSVLDTYHHERHPVGQDVLEHTQAQTALISNFSIEGKELRSLLNSLIRQTPDLEKTLAERLSGLSVAYPASDPHAHPLVGRRAANHSLDDEHSLFTLLERGVHVLLVLGTQALADIHSSEHFGVRVVLHAVEPLRWSPAWHGATALLVRPDGHIAWASGESDPGRLQVHIAQVLEPFSHPVPMRLGAVENSRLSA